MVKYIIKRILLALLILFGVSLILYFLIRLMPVNFIITKFNSQMANGTMTAEDLKRIMATYGFELVVATDPTTGIITDFSVNNSFGNILSGYWTWFSRFIRGDMGESFIYNVSVSSLIASKMGISFAIAFVSLIFEILIAIPLGIKCACNQYGKLDYIVTFLCMIGISFPSFFLGNMLIKWLAVDWGWFDPMSGMISMGMQNASGIERFINILWHMVLPIIVMVVIDMGALMRYTRTNTLEVLNADYIRTARAKGLSEGKVVYKHVFRNTLIPLITTLSFTLPTLFGGAMITETIFNIDGIGQAAYNALSQGDINLIMGYNMFLALLTVIGTLLADIMYAVVDPRVKLVK